MIHTYRMWRFVKIVERYCIDKRLTPNNKNAIDVNCGKDFTELKTLFMRRNYTLRESMLAYSMAIDAGYILNEDKPIGSVAQELAMAGNGFMFASPTGLANALAKSIAQVGSLTTVIIAALALGVSMYAIHQKPEKPIIVVVQSDGQKITSSSVSK
ncbi:MAG TPA: hypothetical protein VNG32_00370 [Candidatus Dormibacteraeota bacterium]|nr:hypothetical protein [Candidatus Dormibacteraeota bacterium]